MESGTCKASFHVRLYLTRFLEEVSSLLPLSFRFSGPGLDRVINLPPSHKVRRRRTSSLTPLLLPLQGHPCPWLPAPLLQLPLNGDNFSTEHQILCLTFASRPKPPNPYNEAPQCEPGVLKTGSTMSPKRGTQKGQPGESSQFAASVSTICERSLIPPPS